MSETSRERIARNQAAYRQNNEAVRAGRHFEALHRRAEQTHERNAQTHDRVADFWDVRGQGAKADRERILAWNDRDGAALERERQQLCREGYGPRARRLAELRRESVSGASQAG